MTTQKRSRPVRRSVTSQSSATGSADGTPVTTGNTSLDQKMEDILVNSLREQTKQKSAAPSTPISRALTRSTQDMNYQDSIPDSIDGPPPFQPPRSMESPITEQTMISQQSSSEQRQKVYETRLAFEKQNQEDIKMHRGIKMWDASGVGYRHAKAIPELLKKHKKWAKAWVAALEVITGKETLVLLGDRGSGKTQMGVELIRHSARNLQKCKYIRACEIGIAIRESYKSSESTETKTIRKFVTPDLLVLDEVQEKPGTEAEQRALAMILDMRYSSNKPTVLIANATVKAFKDIVGPSVIDRICEGGSILLFDWPSFRKSNER